MKRILTYFSNQSWLAILWTVGMCVLFFTPISAVKSAPLVPHLDKLVHLLLFVGFTLLWLVRLSTKRTLILWCGILFGIVVEYMQEGMGLGRSFDIYDIVADTSGVLLGHIGWDIMQRRTNLFS